MARLIGTAGHVDHGKTSLIRALTGIDADRLPEEKSRGLTIDIGFAHFELPGIGRVSIVDVPGHERFLSNMLVGALGVDVALLCVSADESVMPQTREHLAILDLLPVQHLVVALTRSDLVDAETLAFAGEDVVELLSETRFRGSAVVPVSALTGTGLDELKRALSKVLVGAEGTSPDPWYLPIDRVFTVKGHGAVVTGTLMRGMVSEGDPVSIEPGSLIARVRQVQTHDRPVRQSEKGQRTALNLGGVNEGMLHRGMLAGAPGTVFATRVLDLKLRWTSMPRHGTRVRVSIGADEALGKVFLNDHDLELAQVRLDTDVGAAVGQPVIVRRHSPPDLLGGGRVLVAKAVARRKNAKVAQAEGADLEESVLNYVAKFRGGVSAEDVSRAVGRSVQDLGDVFEHLRATGRAVGFGGLWLTSEQFAAARDALIGALDLCHESEPQKLLYPRDTVIKKAGMGWTGKPVDRVVSALVKEGLLRCKGTDIGLASWTLTMKPAQRQLLDRVKACLESSGPSVPVPADIARQIGVPVQAVDGILRMGVEAGEIVRLDDAVWYTSGQIDSIANQAREGFGPERFSASEFRDLIGTSRKYAIPLLEHFDSRGFTFRQGDLRVFVQAK